MRALQVLAREHAAIERCRTHFARETATIAGRGEADAEAVDRLISFFEVQVDGHHQEKEERVLMPRLLARARGEDVLTLETLADEHGQQRRLLAQMRNQLEGAAYGEPNSLAVLVRCTWNYLRAQREHSEWEGRTLFPLAARILDARDDRALVRGFRSVDELFGTSVLDSERALAAWLAERHATV